MTRIKESSLLEDRLIGRVVGDANAPTVIFFGGIHGNEPSGVVALQKVLKEIDSKKVKGSIYAIYGNKWALENGVRFHQVDLNRIWTHERIEALDVHDFVPKNQDEKEQQEIWHTIQHILTEHTGPLYFVDLHTVSSVTKPFVVMNDSLHNRAFTQNFPLPIILGVEEYLTGPLLSYINELGYVAFGFEAGQHGDPRSELVNQAFIKSTLCILGILDQPCEESLAYLAERGKGMARFYEIFFRYRILESESFVMEPGFENFEPVEKGTLLATSNGEPITATRDARIFMPLYQAQGSEGFFAIRPVPIFFLWLSRVLRRAQFDRLLPLLPGVSWSNSSRETLLVDKRVARFFAKQVFHLLGYRSRSADRGHYILRNRETASRNADYQHEKWWVNAKRSF